MALGEIIMWAYEKRLQYPINIKSKNLKMAKLLVTQYGGSQGELAAALRYLNQRYTMPDDLGKALLTDIGTEELAHVEMIQTMISQLISNATVEEIKAAGIDPHYAEHNKGLYPTDANGVPFNEYSNNFDNQNNNLNLFDPYEGYLKGNAFKDEYKPYKNYKVAKINIASEKDEMLAKIGEDSFMMHDLNLYLDVNPNDLDALNKFIMYRNKLNDEIMKYERKYGPLGIKSEVNNNDNFNWVSNWPWGK